MPNNKKKPKKNTRSNKNEKDEIPNVRRKENTVSLSSSRNYIGTEEHQNITKMIQNLRRLKMSHPLPKRTMNAKLKGNRKPICYHGSTEDQFNDRENDYFVALAEWYHYGRRYGSENVWQKYVDDHEEFMEDPEFANFIFALCAREYLKEGDGDGDGDTSGDNTSTLNYKTLSHMLFLALRVRYIYVPKREGYYTSYDSPYYEVCNRYWRSLFTERGVVKCLVRETPCDCIKEEKLETKKMENIGFCAHCNGEFPEKSLLVCSACHDVNYCSRECQTTDWATHKVDCKRKQRALKEISEQIEFIKELENCESISDDMQERIDKMKTYHSIPSDK